MAGTSGGRGIYVLSGAAVLGAAIGLALIAVFSGGGVLVYILGAIGGVVLGLLIAVIALGYVYEVGELTDLFRSGLSAPAPSSLLRVLRGGE